MKRVVVLSGNAVVVVIVVKEKDLGLDTSLFKGGTDNLDEFQLVFPGHVQRHGVPLVQRFVLQGNRLDLISPFLHFLYPLDKIQGIILVMQRIQSSARPFVVTGLTCIVVNLHPNRTTPGRTNDLHVGIDPIDFVQNGEKVLLIQRMDGKVLHPLFVAPGEFIQRKIRSADTHPDERGPQPFLPAKDLFQKSHAVRCAHEQQIVTAGLGNGQAKTVHRLVGGPIRKHLVKIYVFGPAQRHLTGFHTGTGDRGGIYLGIGLGTFVGGHRDFWCHGRRRPAGREQVQGKEERGPHSFHGN